MAKMSIFGNRLKCQEKASLCIKDPQTCPKRAWDDYLAAKGTLLQPGPKSKFRPFSPIFAAEPVIQTFICAVWVQILTPSPFFHNFWFLWTK